METEYKDRVTTRVQVYLSFMDRLKLLLGYTLVVITYVKTENEVGQHLTLPSDVMITLAL